MKVPFAALLAGAIIATTAAPASADSVAAWVYNVGSTPLRFTARCTSGNTAWHQFQVGPGQYASVYANDWNGYCDSQYEAAFGTTQNDGSVTQQFARLLSRRVYVLVRTRSVGYTVHDGQQMIVVANDSNRPLALNLFCAGSNNTRLDVAPGERSWMFTGSPAACSPFFGSVVDGSGGRAPLPTTRMPNGYIHTLTFDPDANSWRVRSQILGTGAEGF
jgi:hypothetical protein